MSGMKRRIIAPWQFGTVTPYAWLAFDAADAGGIIPHFDYLTTYRELSTRLWEPGREEFSAVGYEADMAPVQIPATTKLHGVKGHIDICFGMRPQDLGEFWTDEGVPITIETGGGPNSMAPELAMVALFGDRGAGTFTDPVLIDWEVGKAAWEGHFHHLVLQAKQLRIPTFFCMYRGTYKQIDDTTGWEIDSGPSDDPDTLLSVDITNPSVLESARIDWWDLEMFSLPRQNMTYNWNTVNQEPEHSNAGGSGFVRYPLNLDANKTLGPDQVLWLHIKTGCIRMMALYHDDEGTSTFAPVHYIGHQFSAHMHCSALVSQRLSL